MVAVAVGPELDCDSSETSPLGPSSAGCSPGSWGSSPAMSADHVPSGAASYSSTRRAQASSTRAIGSQLAMVSRLVGGEQVGHAGDQGLCGFWPGRGREMAARFVGDIAGRPPGTIASWPSTRFSTKPWRFPSRSVRRSPLRFWRVSGLNLKPTKKPLIEPGRQS